MEAQGARGIQVTSVVQLENASAPTSSKTSFKKALSRSFTRLGARGDDKQAEQAAVAPLLASYILPIPSTANLVRFYDSPSGWLLSTIEFISVVICHIDLVTGGSELSTLAFLVWPSLLVRLGLLDRRVLFELTHHFEWWFVFINYLMLGLALVTMLGGDLSRLHMVIAIIGSMMPSLCTDAYTLRRARPALGLALSIASVCSLALMSWTHLFTGADVDVPLFFGFTTAGPCITNRSLLLAIFLAKNIFRRMRHQDQFVVIRERVFKSEATRLLLDWHRSIRASISMFEADKLGRKKRDKRRGPKSIKVAAAGAGPEADLEAAPASQAPPTAALPPPTQAGGRELEVGGAATPRRASHEGHEAAGSSAEAPTDLDNFLVISYLLGPTYRALRVRLVRILKSEAFLGFIALLVTPIAVLVTLANFGVAALRLRLLGPLSLADLLMRILLQDGRVLYLLATSSFEFYWLLGNHVVFVYSLFHLLTGLGGKVFSSVVALFTVQGFLVDAELVSYRRSAAPAIGGCLTMWLYVAGFHFRLWAEADYDKPILWGLTTTRTSCINRGLILCWWFSKYAVLLFHDPNRFVMLRRPVLRSTLSLPSNSSESLLKSESGSTFVSSSTSESGGLIASPGPRA